MQATIKKFELKESTDQWPNPDQRGNTKYWIDLDFTHGLVPETNGIGINQDGTFRGSIGGKTWSPRVGAVIDVDVGFTKSGKGLHFTRKQAEGVPMNGQASPQQTNGHAKPAYQANGQTPSPRQAAPSEKPTTLEMLGRLEGAWDLVQDIVNRRHPAASEDARLECTQKIATTLLMEWLRDNGVQMSSIFTAGYAQPAGDVQSDDSVPF